MRIAMWSGPRNLSTAMMYAFAARSDFAVVDEPFYAAYLAKSGMDHPMRTEILASQNTNPDRVVAQLLGSIPEEKPHFYQKHMTQHMIFDELNGWINGLTNIFLIRHPARVIASYAAKRENPTSDDLGYTRQLELFEQLRAAGLRPIAVDSHDIRADPEKMLRRICDSIGLSWDPAMLNWPVGGHRDDGVWAAHWYGAAHRSTGFAGVEAPLPDVPSSLIPVYKLANKAFQTLKLFKI